MTQDHDVQELRRRINTLEEQVDYLFQHLQLSFVPKPDADDPRIVEYLQKGKLIEAVKVYRELYGNIDLADAKRAVEEIKHRRGL